MWVSPKLIDSFLFIKKLVMPIDHDKYIYMCEMSWDVLSVGVSTAN